MPRTGRLNVPKGLFHVIGRGLEKRHIFSNNLDKTDFLQRVAKGVSRQGHQCFAWALMDNHYHFLIRQGDVSLSNLFGPILAGYAISYNKRHCRTGYLFQGRFKSILCEENSYLLELIRYIHLNPLRGGVVANLGQLTGYPWTGHHLLMNGIKHDWYDSEFVFSLFGDSRRTALKKYSKFMQSGIPTVHQDRDYEGGGLLRSNNHAVSPLIKSADKHRRLGDERILGPESFVKTVLEDQGRHLKPVRNSNDDLEELTEKVCRYFSIDRESLLNRSRCNKISKARQVFCYWGITQFGLTTIELSGYLNITHQAISKAAKKGRLQLSNLTS